MDEIRLKSLLILPETTVKKAMQELDQTAERILFVVDENLKLLGTVTDGDIRRGLIDGLKFDASIKNVMHKDFTFIPEKEINSEENIGKLMIENRFEQIPVLDEAGRIRDVVLWTEIFGKEKTTKTVQIYPNQVVIMAGGKGTRLDPFTKVLPKPLMPIGNKPIIEIIMELFFKSGFKNFVYTLNYKKEFLKLFLKENNFNYNISWVEEDFFMGTAGGLSLLKDKIDDTFFVTNCDSLLEIDFEKAFRWHKEQKTAVTVIGCHNEIKIPFGVLEISNGKLESILEKPVHDVIINTGVYIFEPYVIPLIPEKLKVDMDWLLTEVAKKHKIGVYPIYSGWFDMGQWGEYQKSIEKLGIL